MRLPPGQGFAPTPSTPFPRYDRTSGRVSGINWPWGWFGSSSKRQKRAQNASGGKTIARCKKVRQKASECVSCHLNVISGIRAHSIK
ncbi:hypothetical protein IOC09_004960 [Escherichia coli]|nr:hypothetical protein [Escherichia coli]